MQSNQKVTKYAPSVRAKSSHRIDDSMLSPHVDLNLPGLSANSVNINANCQSFGIDEPVYVFSSPDQVNFSYKQLIRQKYQTINERIRKKMKEEKKGKNLLFRFKLRPKNKVRCLSPPTPNHGLDIGNLIYTVLWDSLENFVFIPHIM